MAIVCACCSSKQEQSGFYEMQDQTALPHNPIHVIPSDTLDQGATSIKAKQVVPSATPLQMLSVTANPLNGKYLVLLVFHI